MKFKIILQIFLIGALIFSCQQDIDPSKFQNSKGLEKDKFEELEEFFASNNLTQDFNLELKKANRIVGRDGTVIEIGVEAFSENELNVNLQLIECYSVADILLNNLSTMTIDNKLLETQGMIYLQFTNDKHEIITPKKGTVKIKFPVKIEPETKLFKGIKNNCFIKWETLESEKIVSENELQNSTKKNLVRMPHRVRYSGLYNQKIDTIYHLVDTGSVRYKQWAIINEQTNGWLNLDRFIEVGNAVSIPVSNLSKNTIAIVIFKNDRIVFTADFSEDFKNLILYNRDADILLINEISNSQITWCLASYKSNVTKLIQPIMKQTNKEDFVKQIKLSFGTSPTLGYNSESLAK